jgi:FtsH-binding integral membrane protein
LGGNVGSEVVYVPNYIPQPLEVPGNVSLEPWDAKISFLRRVTVWHLVTVGLVVALTFCKLPALPLLTAVLALAASLFVLCLVRIATRGTVWDLRVSLGLVLTALVPLALVANAVERAGFPAWAPLTGLVAGAFYTGLCGRDFSFVGQYLLSLIASEVTLAVLAPVLRQSPAQAAWAMVFDAVYLTFYCYDLASLMSRRRSSEAAVAAVDLYRDVLNIFGWIVRCIRHWHRHRIWMLPWG